MKNLLFVICLFFAVSVYSQNKVTNLTIYNLDSFVTGCLKDLKIDSATIVIQPVKGLIYGKYQATTSKIEYTYIIGISSNLSYQKTVEVLAEELAHVSQIHSGRLVLSGYDYVTFENKKVRSSIETNYQNAYEIEARNIALRLLANNRQIVLL